MAAGKVGSVWADGTWSETAWEENTWRDAIAAFPLFTEGAYMMVDMGGGIVYLKPLSVKIKGNVTTGNVEAA
jgi:hypothetical protein